MTKETATIYKFVFTSLDESLSVTQYVLLGISDTNAKSKVILHLFTKIRTSLRWGLLRGLTTVRCEIFEIYLIRMLSLSY